MSCGARDTRPSCGGGEGGGSDSDDEDDTMGTYADSGEGSMGLEADAGTILKIAGDAGGCNDNSDASEDDRMEIEGTAGGCNGDYGKSGTSGPGGLNLDLVGKDAYGDSGDVLNVEGGATSDRGAT